MLGAEFLAATGGDMTAFGSAERLAGFGCVARVPRDSGKIGGNLRRPCRYNRRLQRAFCISVLFSIRHCEESRRFYEHKRAEGKRHSRSSSPRPAAASTFSGPSCAKGEPTNPCHPPASPLDRQH
ncbi:transposase [Streptomyces sp. NPDC001185]|uniref:transposase n=1 Tax=Streptomyces sp. NPDC001185 TaxID=3154380 RepID=UPI00331C8786